MNKKISVFSCFCINRGSIVFYSPDLLDLTTIPLTAEIMQDLDIVNEAALERVIKNWMRQSQIVPKTTAVYFVEETFFFTDLASIPATTQEPEVVAFTEAVPFDHVITKVFPIGSGARVVAINKDLLIPILSVLEKSGFTVLSVSPDFAVGITKEAPFTKEVAQKSLLNQDLITIYNFLDEAQVESKLQLDESFLAVKFDKKLIAMIISFAVLVGILIALLVFQNLQSA